jgi:hypothetical protein
LVELFSTDGVFIYKKCVGIMITSRVIVIVFLVLVFQNCKNQKSVFNDTNININNNISYNNLINYKSNYYKIYDSVILLKEVGNKQTRIQSKSTIKNVRNFTPVWGKVENEKTIVPIQEVREQIKTGPIKTLRKGIVIIATLLLIAALLFLFFALIKWQSIFLLWSSICAGISYVLFKLGKKRLKTNWIEADRIQLKKLKISALLVGLISGFIYLVTLVF